LLSVIPRKRNHPLGFVIVVVGLGLGNDVASVVEQPAFIVEDCLPIGPGNEAVRLLAGDARAPLVASCLASLSWCPQASIDAVVAASEEHYVAQLLLERQVVDDKTVQLQTPEAVISNFGKRIGSKGRLHAGQAWCWASVRKDSNLRRATSIESLFYIYKRVLCMACSRDGASVFMA